MATTTIYNELIAVNAVSGTAIADNAVTSVHIAQNNIGTVQLALNSVTSVSIALNQVTGTQIANNAITSTQLADNAVTATKIPDGTQLALGATSFTGDITQATGDYLYSGGGNFDIKHTIASQNILFHTRPSGGSATERMRVTHDGKVGIGTSSPQMGLHVGSGTQSSSALAGIGIANGGSSYSFYSASDGTKQYIAGVDHTITYTKSGTLSNHDHAIVTNNTNRIYIENTGNVGIGTASPAGLLHVDSSATTEILLEGTKTSDGAIVDISFRNGSDSIAAIQALRVSNDDQADLAFFTQPNSGAVTERMRIDSSGNVGIGTTGPQSMLQVAQATGTYSHFGAIATTNTHYSGISLGYTEAANANYRKTAIVQEQIGDGAARGHLHFLVDTANDGNSVVLGDSKMTIHGTSGNVGIGNTNPQHPFIVNLQSGEVAMFGSNGMNNSGAYAGIGIGQVLANNTTYQKIKIVAEGMDNGHYKQNFHVLVDIASDGNSAVLADSKFRIDGADGKVTIGATTVTNNYVLEVVTGNGIGYFGSHNGTYFHHQTDRTYFYWDKACYASGGFHTYSDERLKKDITPVTGALDSVAKMNGVTFKWIDPEGRGGNSTGKQFGVTAQNMLTIDSELPSLDKDPLSNIKEGVNESDEWYTMNYDRLSPFFIEAIKELKTKLEAAEARIKTLEDA